MDAGHAAGSLAGMAFATYKGVILMITSLSFVSWQLMGDTAILAAIGGVVGWTVAEILKLTKQRILRRKHDKKGN